MPKKTMLCKAPNLKLSSSSACLICKLDAEKTPKSIWISTDEKMKTAKRPVWAIELYVVTMTGPWTIVGLRCFLAF